MISASAKIYLPFFQRLASWGFVVAGTDDPQAGTGETTSIALDFVLNESEIAGQIDRDNIGITGYSQGGAGALGAATKYENSHLYKAIFTGSAAYPLLSISMGWEYDSSKISGLYQIRAPYTPMVTKIYHRLNKIAQGAALMTETEVSIQFLKATSNTVPNTVLERVMDQNLHDIPCPKSGGPDQKLAEDIMASQLPKDKCRQKPLEDSVRKYIPNDAPFPASTDVGDVSWICPVAQIVTATWPVGTVNHSWQAVACGKSDFAHQAMLYAGQTIAASAIDICCNPEILTQAWAEFRKRTGNQPYQCPIPKEIIPDF